jgi:hypothetical protein
MTQDQIGIGSTERRLAGWMVCAIFVTLIFAILSREFGIGGVLAEGIIYAIFAGPIVAMVSRPQLGMKTFDQYIFYALVSVPFIDRMLLGTLALTDWFSWGATSSATRP